MNDSSRMTVINSVAELVEEKFGLVGSHCKFMLTQVFFHIIVDQFENQTQFLLVGHVIHSSQTMCKKRYWTMLG